MDTYGVVPNHITVKNRIYNTILEIIHLITGEIYLLVFYRPSLSVGNYYGITGCLLVSKYHITYYICILTRE